MVPSIIPYENSGPAGFIKIPSKQLHIYSHHSPNTVQLFRAGIPSPLSHFLRYENRPRKLNFVFFHCVKDRIRCLYERFWCPISKQCRYCFPWAPAWFVLVYRCRTGFVCLVFYIEVVPLSQNQFSVLTWRATVLLSGYAFPWTASFDNPISHSASISSRPRCPLPVPLYLSILLLESCLFSLRAFPHFRFLNLASRRG